MKTIENILDPVLLRRFECYPLEVTDTTVHLAVTEDFSLDTLDTLTEFTGYQIVTEIYPAEFIHNKINLHEMGGSNKPEVHELSEPLAFFRELDNPIEHYLQSVLHAAIQDFCSDIHFEPSPEALCIRFRKDGILRIYQKPNSHIATSIISRLKLLSHVNIAEKRVPQDGRFSFSYKGRDLDIRASFIPALHGESVVLRILDKEQHERLNLSSLGMLDGHLKEFRQELHSANGLILVTGPTGSGKTTTLYAALQELNERSRKIITAEDPVEYKIQGINQVAIVPKVNRTFEQSLRAILRQSPDVIMIGEIRDAETAGITLQASLTGHLVLSTLHTNDAPSAIMRLLDLEVQPFMIATCLRMVLAQRLVRVVCPDCAREVLASDYEKNIMQQADTGDVKISKDCGCANCSQTGFLGRTGIFELLTMDKRLSEMVYNRVHLSEVYGYLRQRNWQSMRVDAIQKILNGTTTLNEVVSKINLREGI